MKRIILLSSLMATSFAVILSQSCNKDNDGPKPQQQPTEFVADNNSFKDFMSWPLQSTFNGPDPLLGAMAHANNDSTVQRSIYFKDGQNRVDGKFPVGTIIVKHSTNPAGTVNEFTAMVKRGNGFNPNAGDWEFFMLMPDGSIGKDTSGMAMRGANLMGGMCGSCHSGASGKDFIFSK